MFFKDIRRPYMIEGYEQKMFEQCYEHLDNIDANLKLMYNKIKKNIKKQLISNLDRLSFDDIIIKECNENNYYFISQGVYYLMIFISWGILSVEHNKKIDFIRLEMKYIIDNDLINKMKHCINSESCNDMINDVKIIKTFYDL